MAPRRRDLMFVSEQYFLINYLSTQENAIVAAPV